MNRIRRNPMATGTKVALGVTAVAAGLAGLYALTSDTAASGKRKVATGERPIPPRPTAGDERRTTVFEEQRQLSGGGLVQGSVIRIQKDSEVSFLATVAVVQGMMPVPRVEQEIFATEGEALAYVQKKFETYGAE